MPKFTGKCGCSKRFWILPLPFVIFMLIAVIASTVRPGIGKQTGSSLELVNTTSGAFISTIQNGAILFLGIPYAEPPVGDLRWQPPLPKVAPEGINNATAFAPYCYQTPTSTSLPQSEDCLYLNVFIPEGATPNSSLPVRVWIHGGAFQAGGGASFMSDLLAVQSQSIIVTINYRLGIFGFLTTTSLIEENNGMNYGLLDQQLALQWVQQNIAFFGGNPKQVMIYGQSAGGASVAFHLLMQSSWHLYQTALLESPGPWGYLYAAQAAGINDAIALNRTQCNTNGSEQVACLRAIDAETLNDVPFLNQPVIDGVQIADAPLILFSRGQFNKGIPSLLLGNNQVEGNLFAYLYANRTLELTAELYQQIVSQVVLPYVTAQQLSEVLNWYQNIVQTSGYWDALSQMTGDCFINCGTRAIALAFSGATLELESVKGRSINYFPITSNIPVYRYAYTHTPLGGQNAFLNATHQSEVPFVFLQNIYDLEIQPSEIPLAESLIATWTQFHKTGSPNNGSCNWPAYNSTLIIKSTIARLDLDTCGATIRDSWAQICDQWMSQIFLLQTNTTLPVHNSTAFFHK